MGALKDLSQSLLDGRETTVDHHPFTPLFRAERVAEGVTFVSSFANVTAIDTADGLILVDTGSFLLAPATRAILRELTTQLAHTAIYTHGHVDHCFGVDGYEAEAERKVRVVAHAKVAARFDRYKLTRRYNSCINTRQFQTNTEFPADFRYPDATFDKELALEVGDRTVVLRHALGETDDHTFVWLPDAKVLCTGDLFIWATPNCGNPQKVQRYPREWAMALRAMASLGAEVLCPGHGVPIFGADAVRLALEETAQLLESIVDQTLRLMNEGASLDRVLHEVRAPARLLGRPYLKPVYDEPEFIVRNIWRLYGGWWDGDPAELKPAPKDALAREIAALAGGAKALADRALALLQVGDLRMASHLAELAFGAAPQDLDVRAARRDVYAARAKDEKSLMARGIFAAARDESEAV
jgi:alkyl sulfatase BDS1-like metallo-beta-lactamase superfamily hydrolase